MSTPSTTQSTVAAPILYPFDMIARGAKIWLRNNSGTSESVIFDSIDRSSNMLNIMRKDGTSESVPLTTANIYQETYVIWKPSTTK